MSGLTRPLRLGQQFFTILGGVIDRDTQLQFRTEGGRTGDKWAEFSQFTLHPVLTRRGGNTFVDTNAWRRRPGTDGARSRYYSNNSKLLQASGLFRKSFTIISTSRNRLEYGSRHELAKKIISGGGKNKREVVKVTNSDIIRYQGLFSNFVNKNIKF